MPCTGLGPVVRRLVACVLIAHAAQLWPLGNSQLASIRTVTPDARIPKKCLPGAINVRGQQEPQLLSLMVPRQPTVSPWVYACAFVCAERVCLLLFCPVPNATAPDL